MCSCAEADSSLSVADNQDDERGAAINVSAVLRPTSGTCQQLIELLCRGAPCQLRLICGSLSSNPFQLVTVLIRPLEFFDNLVEIRFVPCANGKTITQDCKGRRCEQLVDIARLIAG